MYRRNSLCIAVKPFAPIFLFCIFKPNCRSIPHMQVSDSHLQGNKHKKIQCNSFGRRMWHLLAKSLSKFFLCFHSPNSQTSKFVSLCDLDIDRKVCWLESPCQIGDINFLTFLLYLLQIRSCNKEILCLGFVLTSPFINLSSHCCLLLFLV